MHNTETRIAERTRTAGTWPVDGNSDKHADRDADSDSTKEQGRKLGKGPGWDSARELEGPGETRIGLTQVCVCVCVCVYACVCARVLAWARRV